MGLKGRAEILVKRRAADERKYGGAIQCLNLMSDVSPAYLTLQDSVPGHPRIPNTATMRMNHYEGRVWYNAMMTSRRYQWGAGGTTAIAAWRVTHPTLPPFEAHTIESDGAFVERLRTNNRQIEAAMALQAGRRLRGAETSSLTIHVSDLGELSTWGRPLNWSTRDESVRVKQAKGYVRPKEVECCFDSILIDGRFRAACALSALRLSHEHTIIMLHDYWHAPNGASGKIAPHHRLKPSRAHYNTTLGKWYDHVLRQGTLAVLRPRPKAGAWGFERLLEESERDPA